MRTLTEKYNGVLKGLFSKDQFLRDARMEQSHFITQHNSYGDAVNILLNKGLISETLSNEAEIQGQDQIKYMDSANMLLKALKPTFNNAEIVFRGLNNDLARVTYYTEDPGGESITTVFCGETSKGPDLFFYQEMDETGDTDTVGFDTIEELIQYCKSGEEIAEKMINPDHTAAAIPLEEEVTPEEWDAAKEAARLAKYPEKVKLDDIMAMLPKDKLDAMKAKVDQEWADYLATADYDGPLEEVNLEEGPARNNPKIERLVAGINDLIAKAVDSDGDPIGVIEPDTTWQEPYMYSPIEYKNGQLKITSKSPYQKTSNVDIILSRNMEYEGLPTLRLIMRMYKKAIKQEARKAERMSNQEPDYDEYYSESIKSDIEEKKLTDAEKAGKEKIVKSLAKAGMSKKDPKTYAIATTQAKELYEGFEEVNVAYSDILEVYKKHYTQLANMSEDDAYALHELLKSYFNRLFEGDSQESSSEVKKGDVLKHQPSGVELEVTHVDEKYIRGFIKSAGKVKGVELEVGKMAQLKPVELGSVWNKVVESTLSEATDESFETYTDASAVARRLSRIEDGKVYIFEVEKTIQEYIISKEPIAGAELAGVFLDGKPVVDNTLQEAKEEGYESPKPELPLDVLHHGIRFELDKKEIGNTPTKEEYLKAYKAATKNLEKDLLHYKREEGAEDAPVSKSDEMVKVKLKESFKKIIRNILSENESDKKAFNLNGKVI
jgi:hypothetical protein